MMNEGVFYGLYFIGILLNYGFKLKIEREGNRVERSNLREGVITGVTAYLFYQSLVVPGIAIHVRVLDAMLGLLSLVAGGVFFIKGKAGPASRE
jgi:hypothetical protein